MQCRFEQSRSPCQKGSRTSVDGVSRGGQPSAIGMQRALDLTYEGRCQHMAVVGVDHRIEVAAGKAKHVTPRGRNCDAAKLELEVRPCGDVMDT